ncbi:ABC transporter permease [Sphingomonas lenta]|uniref:Uncharacterized protein n=1 Tax=Sphingomonas lenta TaxID=1141887 RepID=A0A2A2SG09_9SPHN|nr:ABC transporter permease subunit [Sphingomonas lenta]PAX08145.1 hypothetical protein CKY28_11215 [Sphingomonas lenta]
MIAWFELRQQLRGRVFWIVFAVSALMVAGAEAIDALRVGLREVGGAANVLRVHQVWTLFYLFTAAAFVADAVLRDEQSGMAGVVRATPVSRGGYVLQRFAGAFAAVLLCFLSVPATSWAAGLVKGTGAPAGAYGFAFFGLAVPNLLLGCALCFGLATATRSMTGCLLGAVALLTLYGLGAEVGPLWEPFGFAAVEELTRGWSAARSERDWPGVEGVLLANRVLWVGVAGVFVLAGRIGLRRSGSRNSARLPGEGRGPVMVTSRAGATYHEDHRDWAPAFAGGGAGGGVRFDAALAWAQVRMRVALELRQVVLTPPFAVLLLLGLAHAAAALWRAPDPSTTGLVRALIEAFRLAPVVTTIFFAGELYWSERERRMDGLLAAAPVEPPVLVVPKLVALALVLAGLALATAGAGVAVQLARGSAPDLGAWVTWYLLPRWFDWLLVGVLALFFQALSPNKLAGWGLMVFWLIGSMALNRLGWTDPIYRYGLYPGSPLPPALSGAEGAGAFRLYWAVVAGLLAAWACGRSPVRRGA